MMLVAPEVYREHVKPWKLENEQNVFLLAVLFVRVDTQKAGTVFFRSVAPIHFICMCVLSVAGEKSGAHLLFCIILVFSIPGI